MLDLGSKPACAPCPPDPAWRLAKMSRTVSSLLLGVVLLVGVILGVTLERGGSFVAAQVPVAAPGARAELSTPATPPATAIARETQGKASSEDDLYRQLDRQYEQFRHVNQTFELVARAVSPSVVHIVAHKT